MRDDRPFVSLNEIRMDLPCSRSRWEAQTSQAWAALHPWADSAPKTDALDYSLSSFLQNAPGAMDTYTDEYQRFLILTTLTRMIWSNKEATTQPGARHLTPYAALLQGRQDLLQVIDHFSFAPSAMCTKTTPEQFAGRIQQLSLVQLSHIMTADDLWDHLHLIWRRHAHRTLAQDHVSRWMQQNPKAARQFTLANARLLNIIRLYPDNHPQEAYNVFHAGMAVWVMSSLNLLNGAIQSSTCQSSFKDRSLVHLDWMGPADSNEDATLKQWTENGGDSYGVRMHGVPDVFAPEGPPQILRQTAEVLDRMSVWGVAHTLRNATLRVLHADD